MDILKHLQFKQASFIWWQGFQNEKKPKHLLVLFVIAQYVSDWSMSATAEPFQQD